MRLTFRQKIFLSKLLDAYRDMKEPVHYSVIANRLGLNNSTAYDMLRLLEQKGMVASIYGTPKETAGPGRSSVCFVPTAETIEIFSRLTGTVREQDEWDDTKTRVLANLSSGETDDYKDLLNELLDRIPEPRSSLVLCAEVITALLLKLKESKQELAQQDYLDSLLKAPATKLRMSVLAGLILGLSFADHETQRLLGVYQEYAEKYEASLEQLSRDSLFKLHRFTRDVWNILRTPSV
ncbi:helix-turn-helix domain-containing protein [Dehalogenimonas sp. THU2]|uniref:helix-turn-helix domain-containing protein n=1 Tax=Dehalogenimonas sp. THU2 TaxID=3151121 RepID=UPI0032187A71